MCEEDEFTVVEHSLFVLDLAPKVNCIFLGLYRTPYKIVIQMTVGCMIVI